MNSSLYLYSITFALAAAVRCQANVIDFGDYPLGTLASAPNPYQGILNIQAQAGAIFPSPPPFLLGAGTSGNEVWKEAIVANVSLVAPADTKTALVVDPGPQIPGASRYEANLTATFLKPVSDVSFTAACWRFAGYSFEGVDANGQVVTGTGLIPGFIDGGPQPPATGWATFDLNLPEGSHLTSFAVTNGDFVSGDAAFYIQSISFTVLSQVPDGGSTAGLLFVAALTGIGLYPLRRHNFV